MAEPITEFTLFPDLLVELRLKIWEIAANSEPRILEICRLIPKPRPEISEMVIQEPAPAEEEEEKEEEQKQEESSSSEESSDEDDDNDDDPPADEEEEEEEDQEPIIYPPTQFYTPNPIPPLLHTTHEARKIALQSFTLSFPNDPFPAQIYYNQNTDTLYFPSWAWSNDIFPLECTLLPPIPSTIHRLALDNLMWFSYQPSESDTLNYQITLSLFPKLEEIIWVQREGVGCGCCAEWDGPEKGEIGFGEMGEDRGKRDEGRGNTTYLERVKMDCETKFGEVQGRMGEGGEEWERPGVRFVRLFRGGVLH